MYLQCGVFSCKQCRRLNTKVCTLTKIVPGLNACRCSRVNEQSSRHVAAGLALPLFSCIGPQRMAYTFVYTHALYGAEAWAAPRNELARMDPICNAAPRLVVGSHQLGCHPEILLADCGVLPVSAQISQAAAKLSCKVRLSNMSAERFPVAVDSITVPGQIDSVCKKGDCQCSRQRYLQRNM